MGDLRGDIIVIIRIPEDMDARQLTKQVLVSGDEVTVILRISRAMTGQQVLKALAEKIKVSEEN